MGFFLLGIPLGIAGLYTIAKDTSRTLRDERIENANRSIYEQKKQIDRHFVDIVKYCNADCKITLDKVHDVKKGKYGGMELYLSKKGYKEKAINYCKEKFDKIAEEENKEYMKKVKNNIKKYEKAMLISSKKDVTLTIDRHEYKTTKQVEREINKLQKYFNSHNNNVEVNVIMGGFKPHHNHTEVWIIEQPNGYKALDYFFDVCELLDIE